MNNNILCKSNLKLILCIVIILITLFSVACDKDDKNIGGIDSENKNNQNVNDTDNKDNDGKDNKDDTDNEGNTGKIDIDIIDKPEIKDDFLDENNVVTNPESYEVLVNKSRNLPDTYVPNDLVNITNLVPTCLANKEVNQLRKDAAEALVEVFSAAKEELNIQLYARSGYRSYNTQVSLYNGYVKNHGQAEADKFSAKPGQSEHQTGLAMDITSQNVNLTLTEDFGETAEGKWIAENAYRFGFVLRYPKGKEDITGYMYEPWHIRYLGKDLAKKVYDSGLTYDEYFEKR